MSPCLVQLSFFYDFGSTFEHGSEAYRYFFQSFAYVFFDMRSIDFWGHPETSTVGAVRSSRFEHRGVRGVIGAPSSPLGLSPKIEEEEKRRS